MSAVTCAHERSITGGGQVVCTDCGVVLEQGLCDEDEWLGPRCTPERSSREWAWLRAARQILRSIGAEPDIAASLPLPAPRCQRRHHLRLVVLAAYAVWQRLASDLPSDFLRLACGATPREWQRAAEDWGAEDDDAASHVLLAGRHYGLPAKVIAGAARALEEPRLESCEPRKVLLACVAEALGDDLAAHLFQERAEVAARLRARYGVQAFAADLRAEGLALHAHVQRCTRRATDTASLQAHVRACPPCCRRAQDLDLTFLLHGPAL